VLVRGADQGGPRHRHRGGTVERRHRQARGLPRARRAGGVVLGGWAPAVFSSASTATSPPGAAPSFPTWTSSSSSLRAARRSDERGASPTIADGRQHPDGGITRYRGRASGRWTVYYCHGPDRRKSEEGTRHDKVASQFTSST
jgi:hypothetical protein